MGIAAAGGTAIVPVVDTPTGWPPEWPVSAFPGPPWPPGFGGGTAPTISVQPASQTKDIGDNVTFSVTAAGTATLQYQWFKDGVYIPGANSSSYTITGVAGTDAADYTVKVLNGSGQVTSSAATLTVLGDIFIGVSSPGIGLTTYNQTNYADPSFPGTTNVEAMAVHGSDLYVAETGAHKVWKWDGSSFTDITPTPADQKIYALYSFGGNLYAGGQFSAINGVSAGKVAKWNGSVWSAVGTPSMDIVYAISDYGGNLIIGGRDNVAIVKEWTGAAWNKLNSSGSIGTNVYTFTEYDGDLIVGGSFSALEVTNGPAIAKWDGASWADIGSGGSGANNDVNAVAVLNNDLYAVGTFTTIDGVSAARIAKWNGTVWSAVGSGLDAGAKGEALYADTVRGILYIGGGFTIPGNYMAQFNGSSLIALSGDDDINAVVYAIEKYPV